MPPCLSVEPEQGQLDELPNLPSTVHARRHRTVGLALIYAGTPQGNAHAAEESWREALAFLAAWRG
jgi:hypothetical protein